MATDHNFKVKNGLHVLGSEGVYLTDTNTQLTKDNTTSNRLKIQTNHGYAQIGPGNSGFNHIMTDRASNYFNTGIQVDTGIIGSYNEDLYLQRAGTTKLTLGDTGATFTGTISSGAISSVGSSDFGNTGSGSYKVNIHTSGNQDAIGIYATSTTGTTDQSAMRWFADNSLKAQMGLAVDSGRIVSGTLANDFALKSWGNIRFGNSAGTNTFTMTSTGNFQVNGTTVINSSRNLSNIGTISSGAITSSGNLDITPSASRIMVNAYNASNQEGGGIFFRDGFDTTNKYNLSIMARSRSNDGSPDGLSINGYEGVFFSTGSNSYQERFGIDVSGNISVGGTTILNQSRNLSNIGTIQNGSVWINDGTNYNNYNENIRLFDPANGASVIAFGATGTAGTPSTSILGYSDRFETRVGSTWRTRVYSSGLYVNGGYYVGTTAVIDSSRNLVNIGTINTGQGATEVYLMNQNVRSSDSPTFQDLTVQGNLNITGDINSYNVTDLDVVDKTITLGVGGTASANDGGGIIVDGANAKLTWNNTGSYWQMNKKLAFNDTATTTNQGLGLVWTGFDKEGTTDFTDNASIVHTTNTGGHSGSVLLITSQNDANDGIAFTTNASSYLKHNSSNILTAANALGQLGITATAAELNVLDGYTGSVTELNYLDTLHATGVTSTEFDYLDGVTSNIQTQLNGKLTSSSSLNATNLTGTINTARLPNPIQLSGVNAIIKLQETDVTNSPNWWHVADGGNYSIRLNNTGTYPFQIVSNGTNNAVSHIVLGYNTDFSAGIDVTGNITVTGTVDGVDIQTLNTTASAALPKAGGTMTGNLTIGSTTDSTKIVFPDKNVPDDPTAASHDRQLISMGNSGAGGIFQTTGRGGLMLASADDSIIIASGDVGRNYDPDAGGYHPDPNNEEIYLLTDGGVRFMTNLQTSASYKQFIFDNSGNATIPGNITVSGTVDGVDIAARNSVLTSTTTTANAALARSGGTMTGAVTMAGQTWNGDITWNTGKNILVGGESSIDVSGSGYFQIWDSGTGAPFIKCDVGVRTEIGQAGSRGLLVYGEMESSSLDVNGGADISGSLNIGGNLTIADQIRIGDDAWLEDFNVANSVRVKGNQANNQGYIAFGQQTAKLGCNNTSTLSYNGNNLIDSSGNIYGTSLYVTSRKVLDLQSNSSNTERGPWNPLVTMLRGAGRKLHVDEDFASGSNGVNVYNNSGGGTVTHTREDATTNSGGNAPNSSGKVIRIYYNGGTASPGFGGFVQNIPSEDNHTFVQIFQAKLPTGKNLVIAENAQGSNNRSYFLTDTAGTGKWEWYARVSHCGNSGTFSSGGHIYVTGGSGAFSWYLASCTVIDVTESYSISNRMFHAQTTASNSQPLYSFNSDTDTGLGYIGTNAVGLIAGASRKMYVNSSNAYFQNISGGVIFDNVPAKVVTGSLASSDAGTKGLIFDGNYTNGQYRHRFRKQDLGGGVPLFIDASAGTANSYTAQARFGTYTGNSYEFEVFGDINATGNLYDSGNAVWHAGNDGPSSGLNADLLDDQHGSYYLNYNNFTNTPTIPSSSSFITTSSTAQTKSGILTLSGGLIVDGSTASGGTDYGYYQNAGTNIVLKGDSNGRSGIFFQSEKNGTNINHPSDYGFIQFHAYGYGGTSGESIDMVIGTANDSSDHVILQTPYSTGLKFGYRNATSGTGLTAGNIWHFANDGAGSGLSADDVDGYTWSDQTKNVAWRQGTTEAGNNNGLGFWGNTSGAAGSYAIYMSAYNGTYGGRVTGDAGNSDYNMYFKMAGGTNRGFVFKNGSTNVFGIDGGGRVQVTGDIYGKYVNGAYSNLYRFGGLYLGWDNDNYGVQFNHSLTSSYGGAYGDDITLNSYHRIRLNIDSNNNNGLTTEAFEIGHNTTGTGNRLFQIDGNAKMTLGYDGKNPLFRMEYDNNAANGDRWDTQIEIGRSNEFLVQDGSYPLYEPANAGHYGMKFQGNSDAVFFGAEQYTTGHYRPVIAWGDDTSDSPFYIRYNWGTKFAFTYNGIFHADNDVIAYSTTTSDARFKDNVSTIENALDKVQKLRGVEFDWNATSRKGKHDIGFIAQEIEEVIPEVVTEQEMLVGDFEEKEEKAKTVAYGQVTALLVEAIKEQQETINKLIDRINDLEKGE